MFEKEAVSAERRPEAASRPLDEAALSQSSRAAGRMTALHLLSVFLTLASLGRAMWFRRRRPRVVRC